MEIQRELSPLLIPAPLLAAEHLRRALARWLQATNATLATPLGVPVTNRFALRAILGSALLATAVALPAFTGWTALCLLQGSRWAIEAVREFIDLGGCDEERDTINPHYINPDNK